MLQAVLIAISDKNLSEIITSRELQQLSHTTHIELIEEVVQKQYRLSASVASKQRILRQLKCHKEALLLTLRAILTQWVLTNGEKDIVAMYARCGVLVDKILLARCQQ